MNTENDKIKVKPEKGKKYFYYYPQLVVVIGVKNGKKVNLMPCVWNTGLSYDPFLYGVSVGTNRYTRKILKNAKYFSINFLNFKDIKLVRSLGRSSGSELNKVDEFNIDLDYSETSEVPLIKSAYYSLECKKKSTMLFGDHFLFVGEVEFMHLEKSISKDYLLNVNQVSPILYLGVDNYIKIDPKSQKSLKNLPFHYKKKRNK